MTTAKVVPGTTTGERSIQRARNEPRRLNCSYGSTAMSCDSDSQSGTRVYLTNRVSQNESLTMRPLLPPSSKNRLCHLESDTDLLISIRNKQGMKCLPT